LAPVDGSWTRNLKHEFAAIYPTDPVRRPALDDPYYSTDPKYKATASVQLEQGTTGPPPLYMNWMGADAELSRHPTRGFRKPPGLRCLQQSGCRQGWVRTRRSTRSVNFEVTEDLKLSFLVNNLANRDAGHGRSGSYPG
jgi:hypothetical protein